MKTKRIVTILIAVAFITVVLFSVFFSFSLKKIDFDFNVVKGTDALEVVETSNKYMGKNLLTFDIDTIKNEIEENPYFEVVSIKKQNPNTVKVSVNERIETFALKHEEEFLILSKDGHVLKTVKSDEYVDSTSIVTLNCDALEFGSINVGGKVEFVKNDIFVSIIESLNYVSCNDCIKEVVVEVTDLNYNAKFYLYSGVNILVTKVNEDASNKLKQGFMAYNGEIADSDGNTISDYEKFTSSIEVVKLDDGRIRTFWHED